MVCYVTWHLKWAVLNFCCTTVDYGTVEESRDETNKSLMNIAEAPEGNVMVGIFCLPVGFSTRVCVIVSS